MPKYNQDLPFELKQLKNEIQKKIILIDKIEDITGIDQSQISRILRGQYMKKSENYHKLCKFALNNCNFRSSEISEHLIEKIKKITDNNDSSSLIAMYKLADYSE